MIAPNACGGKGFADGGSPQPEPRIGIDDSAAITRSLNNS